MTSGILRGALAGAAGTTALNAATYLDMALRARPASDSPQKLVEQAAEQVGVSIPGNKEERANRLLWVSDHYHPWMSSQGSSRSSGQCSAPWPVRLS